MSNQELFEEAVRLISVCYKTIAENHGVAVAERLMNLLNELIKRMEDDGK